MWWHGEASKECHTPKVRLSPILNSKRMQETTGSIKLRLQHMERLPEQTS